MALNAASFPQHVSVTLGTGWQAAGPHGLIPGATIVLQWFPGGPYYSENGTGVPNAVSNRLRLTPQGRATTSSTNRCYVSAASSPTGATWTMLGQSLTYTNSTGPYTWNSCWTRNPTSYVINGFTPGTTAFITSPNVCYQPEVFSAYEVATEQEWANAQMALLGLVNFPNCIEVTLGTGWLGLHGLNVADVIQLHRVPILVPFMWTEDGSMNPNIATNRLSFTPNGVAGALRARISGATTPGPTWTSLGARSRSAAAPYTWRADVWSLTAGFVDTFLPGTAALFLTTTTGTEPTYNIEVFSAMEYCGGGGGLGGNSPDLLACKRAP